jgi:outer membrane lipoprotein-sorting protein
VSIVNDKATYVPNTNFYGTDSFVVMVSDNHPTQPKATTALVTVNVDAVNDVPLLDTLSDTTISEDAAEQTVSLTGISYWSK